MVIENIPHEDDDNNNKEDSVFEANPVVGSSGTRNTTGETKIKKKKGTRGGKEQYTITTPKYRKNMSLFNFSFVVTPYQKAMDKVINK